MVAGVQSRFTFLAADRVSAAAMLTSPQKTRVRGFCHRSSGRLSRPGRGRSMFTPGSRACAYKTASGRRKWPNRDPLGDPGSLFFLIQNFDPAFNAMQQIKAINLYEMVRNAPINYTDKMGLQVEELPEILFPVTLNGGGGGKCVLTSSITSGVPQEDLACQA